MASPRKFSESLFFAFIPIPLLWWINDHHLSSDDIFVILGFLAIWLTFAGIFAYWIKTARLIITDKGIECYDMSLYTGYTEWDNISAVDVGKNRIMVILSKPIFDPKKGRSINVLNLSSFINYWESGELKDDFYQYARHLFENTTEQID
jgi:hypothetical protein